MLNCLLGLIGGFSTGLMLTWLYLFRESLRRAKAKKEVEIRPEEVKEEVVAYCMRCRARQVMLNPQRVLLKNKRPAIKGTCPNCGGSIFRFIKA